jgi:hypothetical protein
MKNVLSGLLASAVITSLLVGCDTAVSKEADATTAETMPTTAAAITAETIDEAAANKYETVSFAQAEALEIPLSEEKQYVLHTSDGAFVYGGIIGYHDGKILYELTDSQPRIDGTDTNPTIDIQQIYLCDTATNDSTYIAEYELGPYGTPYSLQMGGRYYVFELFNADGLNSDIMLADLENKTLETVATARGYFPVFTQYSEDEFVYFNYYQEDEDTFVQEIHLYNAPKRQNKSVLTNISNGESKEIYAVSAWGQQIYVLYHEMVNDQRKTFIDIIDSNGVLIDTISDIHLGNETLRTVYTSTVASSMRVFGDRIFITLGNSSGCLLGFKRVGQRLEQFYGADTAEIDESYFLAQGSYAEQIVSDVIRDRYLYLYGYVEDAYYIGVLDLETGNVYRFKPGTGEYRFASSPAADENGDMIVKTDNGETGYVRLSLDDFVKVAGA